MALELEFALTMAGAIDDNNSEIDSTKATFVPGSVVHGCHHDLESFYYCLLVLMLWFYEPHKVRILSTSPEVPPKYRVPPTLSRLLFSTEPMGLDDKFLSYGTKGGLRSVMRNELSQYFKDLAPMLEELRDAVFGNDHHEDLQEYLHRSPRITHQIFKDILKRWMLKIKTDPPLSSIGITQTAPPDTYPPIQTDGSLCDGAEMLNQNVPFLRTNTTFLPNHSLGVSSSSISNRLPASGLWPRVVEVKPQTVSKSRSSTAIMTNKGQRDMYAPPQMPSRKRKVRDSDDKEAETMRDLMGLGVCG